MRVLVQALISQRVELIPRPLSYFYTEKEARVALWWESQNK